MIEAADIVKQLMFNYLMMIRNSYFNYYLLLSPFISF